MQGLGKSGGYCFFNIGLLVLSVQLFTCIALIIIITAEQVFLWGLNNIVQIKLLTHFLEYRCVTIEKSLLYNRY